MYPTEYITKYCEKNNYKTEVNSFCLFPAINFYPNLLRVIIKSNRLAKKGIYDDIQWSNSSVDIIQSLENAGVRMSFEGIDNIKNIEGQVIFISNHMSTLETMALPALIQPYKKVVYIIKEELATYPLFGPVVMARDPICVGRENPREDLIKVLEQGSDRIKNGKSIIIFPQKTRTKYFDGSSFNSLGVKLAKKNKVPIIPIALYTEAWGNGKLIKDVGKIDKSKEVKISFGQAFNVEGNGSEEHQKVIHFIKEKLVEWHLENLIVKNKGE